MTRKCTVSCPFFRCSRRSIIIRRQSSGKVILCSLTNDPCIGPKCNFAYCLKHALLPDGTCALSIQRAKSRSIEDEVEVLDRELSELRDKLKRLGRRDVDMLI